MGTIAIVVGGIAGIYVMNTVIGQIFDRGGEAAQRAAERRQEERRRP